MLKKILRRQILSSTMHRIEQAAGKANCSSFPDCSLHSIHLQSVRPSFFSPRNAIFVLLSHLRPFYSAFPPPSRRRFESKGKDTSTGKMCSRTFDNNSDISDLSGDDNSTIGMTDDPIEDYPDPPTVLTLSNAFAPRDRFLIEHLFGIVQYGWDPIDHLLSIHQDHHRSVPVDSVGIACRCCATRPSAPIVSGAVVFPKDFSDEQLVDAIETQLKEHFKKCHNVPGEIARALSSIEHGDSPNNVWRESLESLGIMSVDQIDFKALVFDPTIYGWLFDG